LTDREKREKIQRAVHKDREGWLRAQRREIAALGALYLRYGRAVKLDIIDAANSDGLLVGVSAPALERAVSRKIALLAADRNDLFDWAVRASATNGAARIAPVARIAGAEMPAATIAHAESRMASWLERHVAEDGLNLSARLWRIDLGAQDKIISALRDGIRQGEAIDKTFKELLRGGAPDAATTRKIERAFGQSRAVNVGENIQKLFTRRGEKNIVFNVERVLITETNRVNGHAFIESSRDAGAIGMRWCLSPSHPRADICDDYATADKYGLGPGGYPMDAIPAFPAHPLCLCYLVPIFPWEVRK